tara:strand:- start:159 stop:350 length:192 start_codon:yes stop_codon:yes gene_type:complete
MKVKANSEYKKLSDDKNFISLGHLSTHLRLLAGKEVKIHKDKLPLPKELLKALETKKLKSEDK